MRLSDPRWRKAREWAVTERIRACSTCAAPSGVQVGVVEGKGRTSGIMRCSSVASCPRCREAILAERAHTIETIGLRAASLGQHVYHVVLTYRHLRRERPMWARPFVGPRRVTVDDDADTSVEHENETGLERWLAYRCREEIDALRNAYRTMTKHRWFREFRQDVGWNAVTSLEITHGRHGWHPHYHLFVVSEKRIEGDAFAALSSLWSDAFEVETEHGVDRSRCGALGENLHVRKLESVEEIVAGAGYVSKADLAKIESDVSKNLRSTAAEVSANAKDSREGMTPWEMLVDTSRNWRPYYRAYALAMKGVKVVNFPRALMEASGLNEVRDEEAAIAKDALNEGTRCTIARPTFCAIVRARAVALVDALVQACAEGVDPLEHVREHWPDEWQRGVTVPSRRENITTSDCDWDATIAFLRAFPEVA